MVSSVTTWFKLLLRLRVGSRRKEFVVKHLEHFDLPRREPETGQPLECFDLGIGEEGGTEPGVTATVRKPGEPVPEIDETPWQRGEVEILFELFPAFWRPGSKEEALDVFLRRDAILVRRGERKICLRVGL